MYMNTTVTRHETEQIIAVKVSSLREYKLIEDNEQFMNF